MIPQLISLGLGAWTSYEARSRMDAKVRLRLSLAQCRGRQAALRAHLCEGRSSHWRGVLIHSATCVFPAGCMATVARIACRFLAAGLRCADATHIHVLLREAQRCNGGAYEPLQRLDLLRCSWLRRGG